MTQPTSRLGQHFATAWLLVNCAVVLLWSGWWTLGCLFFALGALVWPIVAFAMLLVTVLWPAPAARRSIAVATALCGTLVGWHSIWLGPLFHVWWWQDDYRQQAQAALAFPPRPGDSSPANIEVDPNDTPPVRVAFIWFAERGDVDGVVYDPTGFVEGKPQAWLHGARPWHLFGPWYQF